MILFCLILPLACKTPAAKIQLKKEVFLDTDEALNRIAFGSCNKSTSEQDIWDAVLNNDPELWIWLGDNIYGDTYDMSVMAAKYDKQLSHPEYQRLLDQSQIIGIWDDHDYGVNDGGKEYLKKVESKRLLLDFLGVPRTAEVRKRSGAYQSYTFGPKDQQVKVILLDTRYFRDYLQKDLLSKQKYKPNVNGDILGEEQWQWLEEELSNSTAQMHIIGSSIQVIPEEHYWEKWANFPAARKRLFDLLIATKPKYPLIISGDRHIAELSKIHLEDMDYPIYEMTASGLTHTWSTPGEEPNQHRIGELIIQRNFAVLEIDWIKDAPQMRLSVRGENNQVYMEEQLEY